MGRLPLRPCLVLLDTPDLVGTDPVPPDQWPTLVDLPVRARGDLLSHDPVRDMGAFARPRPWTALRFTFPARGDGTAPPGPDGARGRILAFFGMGIWVLSPDELTAGTGERHGTARAWAEQTEHYGVFARLADYLDACGCRAEIEARYRAALPGADPDLGSDWLIDEDRDRTADAVQRVPPVR